MAAASIESPLPLLVHDHDELTTRLVARVRALESELKSVNEQKDLLKAVLKITCEDCSLKNAQFEALYTNLSLNQVWQAAHLDKHDDAPIAITSLPSLSIAVPTPTAVPATPVAMHNDAHDHAPVVVTRSGHDIKYVSTSSSSSSNVSDVKSAITSQSTMSVPSLSSSATRSTSPHVRSLPSLNTNTTSASTSSSRHERFIGGGTGTVMVLSQSSSRSAYSPPSSPPASSRSVFSTRPSRTSASSSTASPFTLPAHSQPTVMGSLLLGILPPELQYMFCDFLDYQSLCAVSLVCHEWMRTSRDDALWQAAYVRRWQSEGHNIRWSRQTSTKAWRVQYAERFKVQKHWMEGKPNVMTLSAHTGTITSLRYDDTRLISASDDGSMLLWSLCAPEKRSAPLVQQHHKNTKMTHRIGAFVGHGGPVWCLDFQADEDMLVSGSYDRTIKVWSIKSQAPRATLRGHSNWVSSIQRVGDTIVSGSWDATIKVWRVQEVATATAPLPSSSSSSSGGGGGVTSFVRSLFTSGTTTTSSSLSPSASSVDDEDKDEKEERKAYGALGPVDGSCVATLSNEAGNAVCCLQYQADHHRVACGTRRMAVQIWDVPTATLVQTYMGHVKEVGCLQFDDHKIVSGSGDHSIKVWDAKSARCEMTLTGHANSIMALQYQHDGYKMVSCSYDKTIKVWDMRMERLLSTLEGHSSAVFCLQYDDSKIISGSADKNIKIWDYAKLSQY